MVVHVRSSRLAISKVIFTILGSLIDLPSPRSRGSQPRSQVGKGAVNTVLPHVVDQLAQAGTRHLAPNVGHEDDLNDTIKGSNFNTCVTSVYTINFNAQHSTHAAQDSNVAGHLVHTQK